MKRRQLLKHLKDHGCQLYREGTRHSVYYHPSTLKTSTVPRHSEIDNRLAEKIYRDLGIPRI